MIVLTSAGDLQQPNSIKLQVWTLYDLYVKLTLTDLRDCDSDTCVYVCQLNSLHVASQWTARTVTVTPLGVTPHDEMHVS